MSIDLANIKLQLEGAHKPPTNMMDAARQSLSEAGFTELMRRTDGSAPTPAQLCELADAERDAATMISSDAVVPLEIAPDAIVVLGPSS